MKRSKAAAQDKPARRRGTDRGRAKAKKRQRKYFTESERRHALKLIVSGMAREAVADAVGCSTESLRLWHRKAKAEGKLPVVALRGRGGSGAASETDEAGDVDGDSADGGQDAGGAVEATKAGTSDRSVYAPRDPGQGLGEHEVDAILQYKRKFPSMQPAQLKAQLKRFKGWRVSPKAIARVLRQHGYELVHRGSRPEGPEPIRFEAPRRNAMWQADFAELRVAGERLHLLVVLDDFSRYAVGHTVADSPSAEVTIATLQAAIARHGKPEALRTDRGGAFNSGELGTYLEAELIDHIVGRSYHPQGGGKVESLIGTVRRELWNVEHFEDRETATRRLAEFFEHYNERRAHMGIDGLTPADRFFARADRVLAAIDAISRQRQGSLALLGEQGASLEEMSCQQQGAPLEVLRLVIVDRTVELRFCGARVRLGNIEP
ncbi:MAG: transposase family protein [Deltaproteobacteria bacterium]|nr:transposase family protein [Deltaproteobacteria bacterium]